MNVQRKEREIKREREKEIKRGRERERKYRLLNNVNRMSLFALLSLVSTLCDRMCGIV